MGIKDGDAPVNLVHVFDLVKLIEDDLAGHFGVSGQLTLHAVSPSHPSRREFYTKASHLMKLPPPTFQAEDSSQVSFKLVHSRRFKEIESGLYSTLDWMDDLNRDELFKLQM